MSGIATLADVVAIEQAVPALPKSTYEMIGIAASTNADRPALTFFLHAQAYQKTVTWGYAELFQKITATANLFHKLGLGKNDVIAYILPNLPETHLVIWGGQANGIVFAINPLLESEAIGELLKAGNAKALVTLAPVPGSDLWPKTKDAIRLAPDLQHLILVDIVQYVSGAARGHDELKAAIGEDIPNVSLHSFSALLENQPSDRLLSERHIEPSELSSYFCTGGTTGLPKIAMRSHGNEVANAWSLGQMWGDGVSPGKTLFCGLPMFHVNAVLVTGLLPFSRGAHVLLGTPQGWRGEGVIPNFWRMVEHHKINFFSGVPTIYAALLQQPIGDHDLTTLEYGLCGAAPMPTELMRSFQATTGLKVLEGYGLTEATCVSTGNPPSGERRLGSIGLRIPLQEMKIVVLSENGEYERDGAVGEVGVIALRGPNVFSGYKVANHNKGLWIDTGDGAPWLNTGDLGRQDAEGYFFLTGRKKELIIRGGHNIDPAAIEQPLHLHPAIQIAAAIGRPDAHAGEIPVAYVQLKPGSTAEETELLDFAKAHINERAAVPKAIRIVSNIPLTGVGKIFKPALKMAETEDALSDALRVARVGVKSIRASNDPAHGVIVSVELTDNDSLGAAKEALGQFPFQIKMVSNQ